MAEVNTSAGSHFQRETTEETAVAVATAMELILVEESTRKNVPPSLKTLIENLYSTENSHTVRVTKNDLIVSVIYILMLEMDFVPLNKTACDEFLPNGRFNLKRIKYFCNIPRNWKNVNDTTVEMSFSILPDSETGDVILTISAFGSGLIINLIILNANIGDDYQKLWSYFLSVDKYILNESGPIEQKFNYLRELSIDFKNKIAFPAKCALFHNTDLRLACLDSLPYEMLSKIITCLDLPDFVSCIKTCKYLNKLSGHQEIWRDMYQRKLSRAGKKQETEMQNYSKDWKRICKLQYKSL